MLILSISESRKVIAGKEDRWTRVRISISRLIFLSTMVASVEMTSLKGLKPSSGSSSIEWSQMIDYKTKLWLSENRWKLQEKVEESTRWRHGRTLSPRCMKEFHQLTKHNDLSKLEEQLVTCFIDGFRLAIVKLMGLGPILPIAEACRQASLLEKQLKKLKDCDILKPV